MQRRPARIKHVLALLGRLARDTRGGTAIEYGLIIALCVLAMFAALQGVADVTIRLWDDVSAKSEKAHQSTR
jgi:pilus assembly protein Flp/PilA